MGTVPVLIFAPALIVMMVTCTAMVIHAQAGSYAGNALRRHQQGEGQNQKQARKLFAHRLGV